MTTLVHTADVHLRPDTDERYDALRAVLATAEDYEADVLTIGGDLFDRPEDVETLRSDLRNELFTDCSFEVLLIPGNHDVEAFRGDLFFGDSCTVMAEPEEYFSTWTAPDDNFRVIGIPYQEEPTDELLIGLDEREEFEGTEILIFHGSLDAPINADTGDESDYRYFPVTEELLSELDFDYYLAGHYHSQHQLQFDTGAGFAYSGTPASTRSSETGQRRVVTLDTESGLGFEPLDTFHYLEKHVTVTPGEEDAVCNEIEDWVESNATPTADSSIVVDGFINESESDYAERLQTVAAPVSVTNNTRSVDHLLEHPVIQEFEERLEEKEWDEDTKSTVWTRTLSVVSEIELSGGLN